MAPDTYEEWLKAQGIEPRTPQRELRDLREDLPLYRKFLRQCLSGSSANAIYMGWVREAEARVAELDRLLG